jgi:hypothetical protein
MFSRLITAVEPWQISNDVSVPKNIYLIKKIMTYGATPK